jgi:phenylalanyl-tRNA synthetase alpha chain
MIDIKKIFSSKLLGVQDLNALNDLRIEFLGKKGIIASQLQRLAQMNALDKKAFGMEINIVKDYITDAIAEKKSALETIELESKLTEQSIDITLPGRSYARGKMHPLSYIMEEIAHIFTLMGFTIAEDSEIEDDWHNFTALNIPANHPARQMHDTFYLRDLDRLLRTHTSSVEIRYMEKNQPPFRIISMGRVYRSDYDATHSPMFHQLEGLCVGENLNVGHMKSCISTFLKLFFGLTKVPMRLRSSYFPFTEPSAEVDIRCDRSNKENITIGSGNDWLEILGCGMTNRKVLENVGINPDQYKGFAFGIGIERLAMLKYNIPDLRSFFESDIRWNRHYGF